MKKQQQMHAEIMLTVHSRPIQGKLLFRFVWLGVWYLRCFDNLALHVLFLLALLRLTCICLQEATGRNASHHKKRNRSKSPVKSALRKVGHQCHACPKAAACRIAHPISIRSQSTNPANTGLVLRFDQPNASERCCSYACCHRKHGLVELYVP